MNRPLIDQVILVSETLAMSVETIANPMTREASPGRAAVWTGRVLSILAVLFLLFDGIAKVMEVGPVLEACTQLEVPVWVIPDLGWILVTATLLYAFPRTSFLGAIVLTGYLGGATWTHVRMGGPVFPMVFPSVFAAILWGGLYLREPRLRTLVPWRRSDLLDQPA
jgi:hypothetical protein